LALPREYSGSSSSLRHFVLSHLLIVGPSNLHTNLQSNPIITFNNFPYF
jgi:hypothetical protein